MSSLLNVAIKSTVSRRWTVILSSVAIALSVGLVAMTEKVREGTRAGFENTITGTDLVVGARTGPLSLVLYTIFRLGDPLQGVSYETFEIVERHPDVAWVVPLSLGDSHRGYRVLGTDERYINHYRYADGRHLEFAAGTWSGDAEGAVLGAEVAEALGYTIGQEIILSHGIVAAGFADHDAHPFRIVGILKRTATPVDRTVHVSLKGLGRIHGELTPSGEAQPEKITAFLVGMKNRPMVLSLQRSLNSYAGEPLTAVIPGVALSRLWSIIGPVERVLHAVTSLIFIVGMIGLSNTLLAGIAGRRREIAILRAVGARPKDVFFMLTFETCMVSGAGAVTGLAAAHSGLAVAAPLLADRFGVALQKLGPGPFDLGLFGAVLGIGTLAGFLPGIAAYRQALDEDLSSVS